MYNFGRSRYISFKEYNQDELFLVPPSLHDFLPEGPLARVIHELVKGQCSYWRTKRVGDLEGEITSIDK